jgi:hypothetical protein
MEKFKYLGKAVTNKAFPTGTGDSCPRAKCPVREVDRSPSFIAEVKNEGDIPPLLNMSSWLDA